MQCEKKKFRKTSHSLNKSIADDKHGYDHKA